jgi:ATP-binding cassette subfamily B protein
LTRLRDLRELANTARWALGYVWRTSRSLTAALVVFDTITSVVPAGLLLVSRALVNNIVAAIKGPGLNAEKILTLLFLGGGLTILQAVASFAQDYALSRLSDELNLQVTIDIVEHSTKLAVPQFEDPGLQDVMERAQQNPAAHLSTFLTQTLGALTTILQMVSIVAILLAIEPLVGLILLPAAPPYLIYQWRLATGHYTKERDRATKRRWSRYFVSRVTSQELVPEVKILDLGPVLIGRFKELMQEFRDHDQKYYLGGFVGSAIFAVVTTALLYALFGRIAFAAAAGAYTVGDVAVFGGAMIRLRSVLESVITSVTRSFEHVLYITNLREFLDLEPEVRAGQDSLRRPVRGEIEVSDLWFTYPGSSRAVLKGLTFSIRPGETVAIVGPNGAGKTTLVKLIAHLYEPDSGSIRFDGADVRSLSNEELYSQIGFVFQQFGRYEATAAENIAYGDWRRLLQNREKIEEIARRADVHQLVSELPQGYDTMLGRMFGEHTLSGGQWQLIALARAFARDASLLILDEPTSNLDARSEYQVFSRFRELAQGRTTILISHRFSTVSMADRIIVLEQGEIVEGGTHTELLERGGTYAALYHLHLRQLGGETTTRHDEQLEDSRNRVG